MADLTVSGAGTSAVNGGYNLAGQLYGKNNYNGPNGHSCFWDEGGGPGSGFWTIYGGFTYQYYSYEDTAEPWDVVTWLVSAGAPPVPTVTQGGGASNLSEIRGVATSGVSAVNGITYSGVSHVNGIVK